MAAKVKLREHYYQNRDNPFVFANQSKHSEHYGETPQEQRKRELTKNNS